MSPSWAELGLLYCAAVWGATFFMVKDALAGVDPVAVTGHEGTRLRIHDVLARRVEVRHPLGVMKAWVDRDGRVLRQEMFGVVAERLEEAPVGDD